MTVLNAHLQRKLATELGITGEIKFRTVGGGSINDSYCIQSGQRILFCKVNSATKFPHLFVKEKAGLGLLAKENIIKTPNVVVCLEEKGYQLLVLEWIREGERSERFWKTFGEQLASLHRVSGAGFGLQEDNYMGSVPQQNTLHKNWNEFFVAERLTPMRKRCEEKKLLQTKQLLLFDTIRKRLPAIFKEEPPSLLHGDLWSGNFMCNLASEPVLIDPAVYFGHRSMDLAMTTLFSGFRPTFYEAYQYHFPLPPNYKEQWSVCNLYPLLIHLYLFGTSYLPQIERILKQFA